MQRRGPLKKGQKRPSHWAKPGPKKKPDAHERLRLAQREAARRYYRKNRERILRDRAQQNHLAARRTREQMRLLGDGLSLHRPWPREETAEELIARWARENERAIMQQDRGKSGGKNT